MALFLLLLSLFHFPNTHPLTFLPPCRHSHHFIHTTNSNRYQDSEYTFYNALGRNKISLNGGSYNPFSFFWSLGRSLWKFTKFHVNGNLAGEGIILGGVVVVAPGKGIVYYAKEPAIGRSFNFTEIAAAVGAVPMPADVDASSTSGTYLSASQTASATANEGECDAEKGPTSCA